MSVSDVEIGRTREVSSQEYRETNSQNSMKSLLSIISQSKLVNNRKPSLVYRFFVTLNYIRILGTIIQFLLGILN